MRLLRILAVIVLCLASSVHASAIGGALGILGPSAASVGASEAFAAGAAAASAAAGVAARLHFGSAHKKTQMKPAALGWDVIEMHCAAEASGYPMTVADIIRRFATDRRDISRHYVNNCLARYLLNGDPNKKCKKGSAQRVTTKERKWIKARLTRTPDAYFTEVRTAFQKKWAWRISDRMISKALHKAGARGDKLDKSLSLKVLERVARQRNEDARNRCRAGFAGFPARCLLFFDVSSVDRRTLAGGC